MIKEIKRKYWSRFCRKFNSANLYRKTKINMQNEFSQESTHLSIPFFGVKLAKNGRYIDGIQILSGNPEPGNIHEPILTLEEPEKIIIEKDADGADSLLHISSKNGKEATLEIQGDRDERAANKLVEKIAYSMFERRGAINGFDTDDWLEAEKKVREAEELLIM